MLLKFFLIANLFAPCAFAADGASSAPLGMKKFDENTEVTDAELKAKEGSRSQFSLRFNLGYSGPPVGELSAREQPNPDGTVSVTATAITGTAGLRYRFDPQRSISLTAGVSDQYPFREGTRFDISNPYLSYSRAFRLWDIQLISTPGLSLITAQKLRAVNQIGSVSYALSSIYNLGESGFAAGLDGTANYFIFTEDYKASDKKVRRFAVGLTPSLKWNITMKWNLFTSVTFAYFNARSEPTLLAFQQNFVTGKIGTGYSITRDIYVQPYLGYYPGNPSWKSTSLNLSTVFSIL